MEMEIQVCSQYLLIFNTLWLSHDLTIIENISAISLVFKIKVDKWAHVLISAHIITNKHDQMTENIYIQTLLYYFFTDDFKIINSVSDTVN